ncbi:MAG: SAM-dependent methyltransferase [Planctomycetota bacterium]|jgi:cyclopropane-fatty-acyl-phospholipid synthase
MSNTVALGLAERGLLPDGWMRRGIGRLLRERLAEQRALSSESRASFLRGLDESPIALVPDKANEQHYEVPAAFFARVLGPHMKYSSGYWPAGAETLGAAEAAMLDLSCRRAGLEDGMEVFDLGCGWGSLSLWIEKHYPHCRILALSNSRSQRDFIEGRRTSSRLEVVTGDIGDFHCDRRFDRILSIEMFEHLRNYRSLFGRLASWLAPDGRLFAHVFCHREYAYPFETAGAGNWMGRHFFTGGLMPSWDLLAQFGDDLELEERWRVNGEHYGRTAEAWLENLDANKQALLPVLAATYGERDARRWFGRWRLFFLACAELFGYRAGEEWFVAHYRFRRRR